MRCAVPGISSTDEIQAELARMFNVNMASHLMHLYVAGIARKRREYKSNLGVLYLLKPLQLLEFQEDRMMLPMDMDV